MPLVVTLAGARILLDRALQGFTPSLDDLEARLFVNDVEVDVDTVLADLEEASFTGYFRQQLASAMWTPAVTVAGRAESIYGTTPLQWIVASIGETVYGVYLVHMATNALLAAETLATPRVLDTPGTLGLILTLTGRDD